MLKKLIIYANNIGAKVIAIPFLEEKAIKDQKMAEDIRNNMAQVLPLAQQNNIRLALETELNAVELNKFLQSFSSKFIGVCYDLGNTTSYGHDCPKVILALRDKIFEVHLKDRKKGTSQSLTFGNGDVDFSACFRALDKVKFKGPVILQAWRGENYLNDAKVQLAYTQSIIKNNYLAQW